MFLPPPMRDDNDKSNPRNPENHSTDGDLTGSPPHEASDEELLVYIFDCIKNGSSEEDIRKQLVILGYPRSQIGPLIKRAATMWKARPGTFNPFAHAELQYSGNSARNNILIGGGVFLLGVIVTVVSLNLESGGGRIAIGAIIWGAIQFFYGLANLNQS